MIWRPTHPQNFGNLLPTVLQPLFVVVVRPPPTVQVRVVTYGFLVPRKGSSGSGAILRGKDGRCVFILAVGFKYS